MKPSNGIKFVGVYELDRGTPHDIARFVTCRGHECCRTAGHDAEDGPKSSVMDSVTNSQRTYAGDE